MNNLVLAHPATLKFSDFEVAALKTPSGEKRITTTSVSLLLGETSDWLDTMESANTMLWELLKFHKFTGEFVPCLYRVNGEIKTENTISLDDFKCLIMRASRWQNPGAIQVISAMLALGFEALANTVMPD